MISSLYAANVHGKSQIPLRKLVRSWFEAGSKPNSITLSGLNQLRPSFEPASVMEFAFNISEREHDSTPITSSLFVNSPLSPSTTPSFLHVRLKPISFTNFSHHRLPSSSRTDSTDFVTGPFFSISFLFLVFLYYCFCFLVYVRQIKRATRQLFGARK